MALSQALARAISASNGALPRTLKPARRRFALADVSVSKVPPPPPPLGAIQRPPPPPSVPPPPSPLVAPPAVPAAASAPGNKFQRSPVSKTKPSAPAFEDFLSDAEVERGLKAGELVRGILKIPAYQTDIAFVLAEVTNESNEMEKIKIPVTGFIGRNRAMHGDIVIARPMWTVWKSSTNSSNVPSPPQQSAPSSEDSSADSSPAVSARSISSTRQATPQKETAGECLPEAVSKTSETPQILSSHALEFGAMVKQLLLDAAAKGETSISISDLGQNAEIQKLRIGLGSLRKALEKQPHAFVVEGSSVRLGDDCREAALEQIARIAEKNKIEFEKNKIEFEKKKKTFRDAVVHCLQQTEENSLPLVLLGKSAEIRASRAGLGKTLKKALRHLDGVVELSEEGQPPESVACLCPGVDLHPVEVPVPPPPSVPPPPPPPGNSPAIDSVVAAGTDDSTSVRSWGKARCRVVAIVERRSVAEEFPVMLLPLANGDANNTLKVQPKDNRLPAFWVSPPSNVEAQNAAENVSVDIDKPKNLRDKRRQGAQKSAQDVSTKTLSKEFLVNELENAGSAGVLCVAKFVDWPKESLSPRADIVYVLGAQGTVTAENRALLAFYNLAWRPFEEQVEESLRKRFPDCATVVESELARGRKDLRHIRCMTIDPPTARDLDDAVSVSPGKIEGTWRVGVHVADVTHFVSPGDDVDREARARTTTVYLVGQVYPMLPRWLSENLCSLLPDGDRLAMSVFYTVDSGGKLVKEDAPEIIRGVIRTQQRLNYNEVDKALATEQSASPQGNISAEVYKDLRILADIMGARRALRIKEGAVVMERSQFFFETDDEGWLNKITKENAQSVSHNLIEELMVLANHVVADTLVQAGTAETESQNTEAALANPLLRVHPDTEAAVKTRILELIPDDVRGQTPADASVPELLRWCKQHWSLHTHEAVCADALSAFKEASYVVRDVQEHEEEETQETNAGHWGLSLESYMHFTSPIRRYADVLVHRRINRIIGAEGPADRPSASRGGVTESDSHVDFFSELKSVVGRCNEKKRDAQDASQDSKQLALSTFVRVKGGLDVDAAVVTRIHIPSEKTSPSENPSAVPAQKNFKQRHKHREQQKEALEFYVPPAQCSRSVSFDALGIELVPDSVEHSADGQSTVKSVRVRVKGSEDDSDTFAIKALEPLTARLVSEGTDDGDSSNFAARRWTVRLPRVLSGRTT